MGSLSESAVGVPHRSAPLPNQERNRLVTDVVDGPGSGHLDADAVDAGHRADEAILLFAVGYTTQHRRIHHDAVLYKVTSPPSSASIRTSDPTVT